jgi:putative peptide maturation dehydrogenase
MMNRTKDSDPFQDLRPVILPGSGSSDESSDRTYFQMMTQLSEQLRAVEHQFGPAPPHFYEVSNAKDRRELPLPEQEGPLFDLLRRRKTVRLFDPDNPMTETELSTVLYFTFGCHGIAALTEGLVALRKTSPSGGALHPIEAYPVILNVRGWTPGLYHYNVQNHRMDLLRGLERPDGVRLVSKFTGGQSYFATAHVVFILTARFQRNFWKYRRAPRSFRVIQLDAGHLSQTMYLVCTAIGLGAFFTAAINDINIEEELGIEAVEQGVVGILGCGRTVSTYPLTFETIPYVPREPAT